MKHGSPLGRPSACGRHESSGTHTSPPPLMSAAVFYSQNTQKSKIFKYIFSVIQYLARKPEPNFWTGEACAKGLSPGCFAL